MKTKKTSQKLISVILSALMVLSLMPITAFVSTAATNPVYSGGGEWLHDGSDFNSNYTSLNSKGGTFYTSMAIPVTNYYFMQTTDNQVMTYTADFYACKNDTVNAMVITSLNTNATNDTAFAAALSAASTAGETPESWANPNGYTNNFGGGANFFANSNGVEAKMGGIPHFTYTVTFVANGSAVYEPQWEIGFKSRGGYEWLGYTFENYITSHMQHDSYYINENPTFHIQVIDLREVNNLIAIANSLGINPNTYTGGRDFSGATYYSQETVDEVTAALRAALLCDYSELDAQLARAAAIEPNYVGKKGNTLYDSALYDIFTDAYADAQAVDRFLMEDGTGANEAIINDAADALEEAIDNLIVTRSALITYYSDGVFFDRNVAPLGQNYNFHDVTDKFIGTPTMSHYVFDKWTDVNGNKISDNTVITGDMDAYASFVFDMEGIAPLESSGSWTHKLSPNDSDGRGDYYVTMWVQDTNFKFVQTTDNETFSFYTDLFAYKNDGGNVGRIKNVGFLSNDTQTDEFLAVMGSRDAETYCVSANSGPRPSANDIDNDGVEDGTLPGQFGNGYTTMKNNYCVDWRYVYTFDANGSATYVPKWDITYYSANDDVLGIGSGTHTLADEDDKTGLDKYVNFTITVTDVRALINEINKAESIYHNPNSYQQFDQDDLDALRAILDFIEANYTLDGSVYYEQTVIDSLVNQIKQVIPDGTQVLCDYTELDAAIRLANEKRVEYNDNADSHYINEVWANFMSAYTAATSVDRNLYIIASNENQTMIDGLTEDLLDAIEALNFQTHVNQPCDYTGADDVLEEANQINNDNGKYDDDAYQNFEDAKDALEDLLNLYDDENGNNQAAVDQAVQDLQDAIDALNDANNQNSPCDYTLLDQAIANALALDNSTGIFTTESFADLEDALTAAQAISRDLYDNGTNQQIINQAANDLLDAISALVPDKTALQDAVNQANAIDTADYTDASAQALQDAIDAAQAVLDDDDATVQDVANALSDLLDAIDALTPDKTVLEETINLAESIDTTNIDPTVVQDLEDAITAAQTVDNDPDATVTEIKDAIDALNDAIDQILQSVVDDANNIDTTGMTPISSANLEDAIDAAQDIIDNGGTTQEKVDAVNALTGAIDSLAPDKTELGETIDAANDIDTSALPAQAADDLQDAIDAAQTVYDNDNATVQEIADATEALKDAIDQALQDAINAASNTDTTGMDPATVQALEDAIQNAEDVLTDPNSTIEDKVDAINDLAAAVDGLTVDKSALEQAINDGEAINQNDYTASSAQALQDAIDHGYDILNNDNATATDVEQAVIMIQNAINDLVDITALHQAIQDAENIDTIGMTPDSVNALQDALDDARDVYDNPDATQQEVDDAIAALEAATAGLEYMVIIGKTTSTIEVDRDTNYTYMVGLDTTANTSAELKASLKNDESTIIITKADGTTELTADEHVGTGCLVKLVSASDHSIVYEVATVILYGDVNGDGVIDGEDVTLLKGDAYFGESNIDTATVYFYAADLDGDTALDAFDVFYQNGIMTGQRYFNQAVELYK